MSAKLQTKNSFIEREMLAWSLFLLLLPTYASKLQPIRSASVLLLPCSLWWALSSLCCAEIGCWSFLGIVTGSWKGCGKAEIGCCHCCGLASCLIMVQVMIQSWRCHEQLSKSNFRSIHGRSVLNTPSHSMVRCMVCYSEELIVNYSNSGNGTTPRMLQDKMSLNLNAYGRDRHDVNRPVIVS